MDHSISQPFSYDHVNWSGCGSSSLVKALRREVLYHINITVINNNVTNKSRRFSSMTRPSWPRKWRLTLFHCYFHYVTVTANLSQIIQSKLIWKANIGLFFVIYYLLENSYSRPALTSDWSLLVNVHHDKCQRNLNHFFSDDEYFVLTIWLNYSVTCLPNEVA